MGRIKELVRLATLKRHGKQGHIAEIHIVDEGDGFALKVYYHESVEGAKVRYLTGSQKPGRRKLSSTDTAWNLVKELELRKAQIRLPEDEDEALIREDNADSENT
ncbi:MAG: hypothetical protein WBG92_02065 [Thiohalocapsa sp.]